MGERNWTLQILHPAGWEISAYEKAALTTYLFVKK